VPAPNKPTPALLALAGALTVAGCGENPAIAIIPVRLELTPAVDTVSVGRIESPLTARVYNAFDDEIPDPDLTWGGNAPSVAAVDTLTGAVTGLAPGVVAVTARSGSAADTAAVFVLDDVPLRLPYDTILLAPGDTFTIEVEVAPGGPAPVIWYTGGTPGVATVDSATGLVTAVGPGTSAFAAQSDSAAAAGLVEVLELIDTVGGAAHLGLSGAVTLSATMPARARNHPTDDGGTLFQFRILDPGVHELDAILIDSLDGPETRLVEAMTAGGLGDDPVCLPPASFVFYQRGAPSLVTALSLAGGRVTVTSDTPVSNGRIISGRLDVTLQRTDVSGPAGLIRARGTFVVPLTTLDPCPK
jgi:hypothetical protein